jgi:hypothetical protein
MKYSSLDELPPQLKEVAELRLTHPDWSYVCLSEVLGIKPDTVGGIFRKIAAIEQKLLDNKKSPLLMVILLFKSWFYTSSQVETKYNFLNVKQHIKVNHPNFNKKFTKH